MASQAQQAMLDKILTQGGFIAALDQSGGSTPKALKLYGIDESAYANDDEMFDMVHAMRTRIITCNAFSGERVLGAILFENTLDRDIEGLSSANFLWQKKRVVPFLKVDKGLEAEANGVQLMKPMPGLDELLAKANAQDVFGTKMRSVVKLAIALFKMVTAFVQFAHYLLVVELLANFIHTHFLLQIAPRRGQHLLKATQPQGDAAHSMGQPLWAHHQQGDQRD